MFTGIIKNLGIVKSIQSLDSGLRLVVTVCSFPEDISTGDSISINGSCLTLVEADGLDLSFDIIGETLDRTTAGSLNVGDEVNVELSMRLNDFVGGHLVSGHIDFVSELINIDNNKYWFTISADYSKYVVVKGSITVNGVSLTVNEVLKDRFRVDLIPETLNETNLKELLESSSVNIEIDLIARYLEKLI